MKFEQDNQDQFNVVEELVSNDLDIGLTELIDDVNQFYLKIALNKDEPAKVEIDQNDPTAQEILDYALDELSFVGTLILTENKQNTNNLPTFKWVNSGSFASYDTSEKKVNLKKTDLAFAVLHMTKALNKDNSEEEISRFAKSLYEMRDSLAHELEHHRHVEQEPDISYWSLEAAQRDDNDESYAIDPGEELARKRLAKSTEALCQHLLKVAKEGGLKAKFARAELKHIEEKRDTNG